jgi:hypothetical protein
MRNELKIQLTKPAPIPHKELEVNGRELFKALGKAIAELQGILAELGEEIIL